MHYFGNILHIGSKAGKHVLTQEAQLKVTMQLPSWFPFPVKLLENQGSASIQKKIVTDLNNLNNVIFELENKYSKSNSGMHWNMSDMRDKYDKYYKEAWNGLEALREAFKWDK